jgi:hypothetical protein
LSREYATHLPVLRRLFNAVEIAKVLEYGGGLYSTRWFLRQPILSLWTVETDTYWATEVSTDDLRHSVVASPPPVKSDLIFIDDGLSAIERAATIRRVSAERPNALVVIHDFEQPEYQDAAAFDHRVTFSRRTPWTGVMWNESPHHWGLGLHRLTSTA